LKGIPPVHQAQLGENPMNYWLIDSGTSAHMTPYRTDIDMNSFRPITNGYVKVANDQHEPIIGIGNVTILIKCYRTGMNITWTLFNVVVVPTIVRRLIATDELNDAGHSIGMEPSGIVLTLREPPNVPTQRKVTVQKYPRTWEYDSIAKEHVIPEPPFAIKKTNQEKIDLRPLTMAEEGDFETPRAHLRNQMKHEAAAAKLAISEGLTTIEEDQGKEKFWMEMQYSPPKNSDGSTMTYADGSPVVIQVDALPPTMTVFGKILEIVPSARIKSNKCNMEFMDMVSFLKGPDVVKFFDYEGKHRGTGSTKVEIGFLIVSEEDSSYETLKVNEEFMQLLKAERVNVFKDKHESFGLAMIGYIFMKSPEATNNKKFEQELEYELMKAKHNGHGGKLATTDKRSWFRH
jgi:hypothetical protein